MLKTRNGATIGNGVTMSVPEAGQLLGIGRNAAYEAAHRGDIPSITIGKLIRVPVAALNRLLEGAGQKPTGAA
jgi:excisionase family DNA binding protein